MNEMNEMTISLKDLFCRVLLRWRLIFVFMLIGAVLLGGAGYLRNKKNAGKSAEEAEITREEVLDKYEEELSDADIQIVKATLDTYAAYQESSEFVKSYIENSIKMKLNATQLPTIKLQYYIDTHYEVVYPVVGKKDKTSNIMNSYATKIRDTAVYEKIADVLGDGVDAAYVGELISIDYHSDILVVTVIGLSEKDCQDMVAVLKGVIVQETDGLKKIYGDYEISLVDEAYSEYANSSLLTEQRQQTIDYNNQLASMSGLSSGLTEEQKQYYDALLEEEPENEAAEETVDAAGGYLSKKYIVLGAFAGIFLVCCYVACQYLLSARLRVKEDLEECFGVTNLGVIPGSRKKRKILDCIDRWIISKLGENAGQFSEEERIRMICAGISIGAKKSGMKSVYLTGVCNDESCGQMKKVLCDKMRGNVDEVQCGKSIVYDPESLESLVSSDGVVLVEKINGSRYDELKKEIEVCRQNQVKIIGSVILS